MSDRARGGRVRVRLPNATTLEIHVPGATQAGTGSSSEPEPHFLIRRGSFILKTGSLPEIFYGRAEGAVAVTFVLETGVELELNIPGASAASAGTSTSERPWFVIRSPTRAIVEQGPLPREFFDFD